MSVRIVADGLSQDEAYSLERETIMDYVFNKGYGIDIPSFNNKDDEPGHLTNHSFGGAGNYGCAHTEEWKRQHSLDMSGEKNPMYGVNVWDSFSEEKANEVREKQSKASKGENNPMYGISPKDRMDEETYKEWLRKIRERMSGQNNPNYHNDTLKKKYEANPELKQLLSRPRENNGRARKVYVYDLDMNFVRQFSFIGECCEWLNSFETKEKKINSLRARVSKAMNTGKPYKNYLYFDCLQ